VLLGRVANKKGNMKRNTNRVPTRFGPETRFEIKPAPPAPFRATQETRFERLKEELLLARLATLPAPELNPYLRRAANEAAALAWVTPYPLLFFPALFEEKADDALVRVGRQQDISQRSRALLAV
jgi:hypothetical protein